VGLPGRPLLLMLLAQAMVSMAIVTVPVLAPSAVGDIGIEADYIGLYIGLVYLASMLTSIACGGLIRRFGAIRVSQCCLLVSAAGLTLLTLGSPLALVVSAVLLGCAQGPVTPASSHLLVRLTDPGDLALCLSIKQTGVPLGGAVAGAAAPLLVLSGGWQIAALCIGAACVTYAFLIQPSRDSFDADRKPGWSIGVRGAVRPLIIAVRVARIRRLAACAFTFSALQLSLVTYLVTYLHTRLEYTLLQAGLMLALLQATSIAARIVWGAVADRISRPSLVLAILAFAMASSSALLGLSTPDWTAAVMAATCVAIGATALGWNGVVLGEVAREAPEGHAMEATGGVVFFTYLGVLIGPPAFALATQLPGGYSLAFVLLALPPLVCFAWLAGAALTERREVLQSTR